MIINLGNRRPVSIVKDNWPVIGQALWHDNQYEFQANRICKIFVRENTTDSRCIVYGIYSSQCQSETGKSIGEVVSNIDEAVPAIQRVSKELGHPELAQECINSLPEVDI